MKTLIERFTLQACMWQRISRLILAFAVMPLLLTGTPVQAQQLMVWGDDTFGQISAAPHGCFKAVAGGSINGLALRCDGTPVLWGSGPIGPPPIPYPLESERFRAVALGRDDAVLIHTDGTLAAFGQNTPVTSLPAGHYRAATVASVYAVAIADDGTLTAWGSDNYPPPDGPLMGLLNAPGGGPFKQVDARVLYSLALHENGTLYGWGHGAALAGWTPTPEDPSLFYIPDETFTFVAVGNVHALAIRFDGTVTGWGDGTGGALDPPPNVRFKAVAAGWGFSVGLSTDGTLWGWGTPFQPPLAAAGNAWTFASQGWTRFGNRNHYYMSDKRFQSIAAAAFHIAAITAGTSPSR